MVLEPGPLPMPEPQPLMESSLMGLATVLSPIRSCTDLLEHGVHTRFASQPQDWWNRSTNCCAIRANGCSLQRPAAGVATAEQSRGRAWASTAGPNQCTPTGAAEEQISGAPLDPPDRLGRDLLRNLLQPPHQAVDWMSGPTRPATITAIGPTRHRWIAPAPTSTNR